MERTTMGGGIDLDKPAGHWQLEGSERGEERYFHVPRNKTERSGLRDS